MNKIELQNVKKVGGGGGKTAKKSSIPAENSSYPANFDRNCENSQNLNNAQNAQNECIFLTNKNISESAINCARVACKSCGENYSERKNAKCSKNLDNCGLNNKNQTLFKNGYKNANCKGNAICNSALRYKNNVTQNDSLSCKNSASCKRDVSCQSKACYKNTACYKNDNGYKSCTTKCSATTKICLWLFLFVACLAVTIGFGYGGGSNGSLNVALEIETASAEGETWSGSGTASDPYQIANYADLLALSTACNTPTSGTTYNHYQGVYFKLTNNITLGTDWVPIATNLDGTTTKYFSGIFDGTGYTISFNTPLTFTLTGTTNLQNYYLGSLIGYLIGGAVKNVTINFSLENSSLFTVTTNFDMAINFGGIVGGCQNSNISNCNVTGSSIAITPESPVINFNYFGGILGSGSSSGANITTIDNCGLSVDVTLTCCIGSGIVYSLDGNVSNCVVRSNFLNNTPVRTPNSSAPQYNVGGIAGKATNISNCKFLGGSISIESPYVKYVGVIAGEVTAIDNCLVAKDKNDVVDFDLIAGFVRNSDRPRVGLIAGKATTITNCSVDATGSKLSVTADSGGRGGILAGEVDTMSNCVSKVSVSSACAYSGSFGFIVGVATGTISNCISIVDGASAVSNSGGYYSMGYSGIFYNCVVVGVTNVLTNSISGTDGSGTANGDAASAFANTAGKTVMNTSNGLYALSSTDNTNIAALKNITTYTSSSAYGSSATTTFKWNVTTAYEWDFENIWYMPNNGNDYPALQITLPTCTTTINITTNLSGSTSGTTTGSSGSSSTTNLADQFIIYRFDESGNLVNQFVVRNGSTVTFEVDKNKTFTIMINYKLYMVTKIDGAAKTEATYTPTADTTIDIHITAPAGVNNWIVI